MNILTDSEVREWFAREIPAAEFAGQRVLVIVPDSTRTAPLPLLFSALYDRIGVTAKQVDVLVALGTHPPMPEPAIAKMLGMSDADRAVGNVTRSVSEGGGKYANVRLFNHEWNNPARLTTIGTLTKADTEAITEGRLSLDVPVTINSRIADYDTLLVLGPVFPHEVVGFSGGNKYYFPGISGPELLNFFHWLGAIITNVGIIGVKGTPVRAVVDRAATLIPNTRRAITFIVASDGNLHGLFYGTPESAWESAADLSSQVHIKWMDRSFHTVLSCAPPMYDELWVAGKCMYKLEPVVADGGELIIFAPHLHEISVTHGKLIAEIGYHVRDYFTKQWDRFKDYPWGVLAHSTHVRGTGTFDNGLEQPRVRVTLASQIPAAVCEQINLGYRDPATIDVESFANRESEGVLLVRKAGEYLYRLK